MLFFWIVYSSKDPERTTCISVSTKILSNIFNIFYIDNNKGVSWAVSTKSENNFFQLCIPGIKYIEIQTENNFHK